MAKILELGSTPTFLLDKAGVFSVFDNKANSKRTIPERTIAIGLRPLMISAAWGKGSHWFDYKELPNSEVYDGLKLPGDLSAFEINHLSPLIKRLNRIRMSLGGCGNKLY